MMLTHHENVLKLYAVVTQEVPVAIVTELMNRGSLHHYLESPEGLRLLKTSHLIKFCLDIAHGMAYLEDAGFVHRSVAGLSDWPMCLDVLLDVLDISFV